MWLRVDAESGAGLAAAERQRQVDVEGYSLVHDAGHADAELAMAAVAYAENAIDVLLDNPAAEDGAAVLWPWHEDYWKPSTDPVRTLVKAAALLIAQIDRELVARRAAAARTAGSGS